MVVLFQGVTAQSECSGLCRWFSPEIPTSAGSLGPHRSRLRTEVVLGQLIRQPVDFEAAAATGQKHRCAKK